MRKNLVKPLQIFFFLQIAGSCYYLGKNIVKDYNYITDYTESSHPWFFEESIVARKIVLLLINILIVPSVLFGFKTLTNQREINIQRKNFLLPLIVLLILNLASFTWYLLQPGIYAKEGESCVMKKHGGEWFRHMACIEIYIEFIISVITLSTSCNYLFQLLNFVRPLTTTVVPPQNTVHPFTTVEPDAKWQYPNTM